VLKADKKSKKAAKRQMSADDADLYFRAYLEADGALLEVLVRQREDNHRSLQMADEAKERLYKTLVEQRGARYADEVFRRIRAHRAAAEDRLRRFNR
jgi:hypothetical protein